jgi:hypothetical protein
LYVAHDRRQWRGVVLLQALERAMHTVRHYESTKLRTPILRFASPTAADQRVTVTVRQLTQIRHYGCLAFPAPQILTHVTVSIAIGRFRRTLLALRFVGGRLRRWRRFRRAPFGTRYLLLTKNSARHGAGAVVDDEAHKLGAE